MTTRANAQAISEETVRALSLRLNEPAWLLERRLAAWRAFEAMSMPDPLEEEWRRTDISGLDLDSLLTEQPQPEGEAGLHAHAAVSEAPTFVYGALSEHVRTRPDLVQTYLHSLVKPTDWKLQSLQAALFEGALIYVPRGVEVEAPVAHLTRAASATYFPHLLIVVEENASLTVLQETASRIEDRQTLVSAGVEILCGPDARLRFVETQSWGAEAFAFSTIRVRLERGAQLQAGLIGLGGRLAKTKLEVTLAGEGASAELLGLSFAGGKQHFDYVTLQDHLAPRTSSDLLFKAALDGESSQVWTGTVRIQKGASQSDANQASRNLLLSEHAKAAPIPILEIEAYDVLRCSHGATAGPLDEDQLFYLESRGIPPAESERLLVEAFFQEVIDRLPVDRDRLQEMLSSRIGAGS